MSGMISVMPPIFLAAGMAGRRKIPVRAAPKSLHGPPRDPCAGRREIPLRALYFAAFYGMLNRVYFTENLSIA